MSLPRFTKKVIGELDNSALGADMNTLFNVGDLNRDGHPDIFTAGRDGNMAWFENPGKVSGAWQRHLIDCVSHKECGGLAYDLTGDGYPDIINGSDWRADELNWWENPGKSGKPWTRYTIVHTGHNQFHDELIGDVTGDGRKSLIFWNQGSGALSWVPLPQHPRTEPWAGIQIIAENRQENGQAEEGLAITDIDGDGKNEIIAGMCWYKYRGKGNEWEQHKFAQGYITTVIAVADIDGDGKKEILLSEGDACICGRPEGGRLAWFKPKTNIREMWEEHLIEEKLLDPHSLQVGAICGKGHQDILVGEIGARDRLKENPPRLLVFENDGNAHFTRHVLDEGTGTHHARLVDFRGKGVLDIASRPLHGPDKWKIFVWYNERV